MKKLGQKSGQMNPKKILLVLNEKCFVWCTPSTAFQIKNPIPALKHGGGGIMVSGCFASSGPGRLVIIDSLYILESQRIVQENVRVSVSELKLYCK